jgi:hypothetical protein
MKTLKLNIGPDIARRVLKEIENDIAKQTAVRDGLSDEISKLVEAANALRAQLHGGNGGGTKAPTGENKTRIVEFLRGAGNRGAKLIQIHKATGISVSSIIFTLKKHTDAFKKTPGKAWKLVNAANEPGATAQSAPASEAK